jgi:hypothetical protein
MRFSNLSGRQLGCLFSALRLELRTAQGLADSALPASPGYLRLHLDHSPPLDSRVKLPRDVRRPQNKHSGVIVPHAVDLLSVHMSPSFRPT